METYRIISADSHIVEPADFWTAFIDRKYLERAPHAQTDEHGAVQFFVDGGKNLGSVGAPSQAGLRFDSPEKVSFEGKWEEVRPGCSDPVARLKDLEADGVVGEVIHPTLGARLYGIIDGELLTACCKAGNDWMIERFCVANPKVFKGLALLNVDDVPTAVAELRRCVRAGLSGGMIPTYPGEEHPYDDPIYDPLWAAAQDLSVPLNFHVASTRKGPGQLTLFAGDWQKAGAAAYRCTQDYWVRRSVAAMVFAGVFDRFPGLNIAIVEHEASWAIAYLAKMDATYKELSQAAPYRFKDGVVPSDFFRTNIFISFQEDKAAVQFLPSMIGTDTLMFGSDYPHAESTWPNSRRFLDDLLQGTPPEAQRKFRGENVARLFKFN